MMSDPIVILANGSRGGNLSTSSRVVAERQ